MPAPCASPCIRPFDQRKHRPRKAHSAAHGRGQQFLATPLQVSQALLMKGLRKTVVHAPTVVHERARPVEPQQLFGRLMAPRRINHVTRRALADEGMQPGRAALDAPSSLIRRDLRRASNRLPNLLVSALAACRGPLDRSGAGGPCDVQALEQRAQEFHALAMRQPQLLVEQSQNRVHVGTQLTGRSTAGGRCLQRMPALYGAATVATCAHVNVKAAIDDRAGNLGLILSVDVRFAQVPAAAVRTFRWQRHIVGFVDPRRNTAMGVRPVTPARLATRFLRLRRRFVLLAKRRCLPLAATTLIF